MKHPGMDPDDGINERSDFADDALTLQLQSLHREVLPATDLWPGIAARLQARPTVPGLSLRASALPAGPDTHDTLAPGVASGPGRGSVRRRHAWQVPFALAATVVLGLGVTSWWQPVRSPTSIEQSLIQREAMGMTRQYRAALAELDNVAGTGTPVALQPAFDDLDRNARLILEAIDHDPDSRLLLQQLRRTYTRHLALAQRSVLS